MTCTVHSRPRARLWRTAPPADLRGFHRSVPGYAPTRLIELPQLAEELGAERVWVKEEAARYGLPAFKMLGAGYAIARALTARLEGAPGAPDLREASGAVLSLEEIRERISETGVCELVAATDGNHGRAVARTAAMLGLAARIFTPVGVSAEAVAAIRSEGAEVAELESDYDEVVAHAAREAEGGGSLLVQDTSWEGYEDIPAWIVDGYGTVLTEAYGQLSETGAPAPTLVTAPTGVGAFAEAVVRHSRSLTDGAAPHVLAVEPSAAPSLTASLLAGRPVTVETGTTIMAGLNCGTPAAASWPVLHAGVDLAAVVTDEETARAVADLEAVGVDAGPCGAASLAGVRLLHARRLLPEGARILLLSTEGRSANPLPAELREAVGLPEAGLAAGPAAGPVAGREAEAAAGREAVGPAADG
jgi:diaminopropionate ammonia-lyase